jgi:hypothetical protein
VSTVETQRESLRTADVGLNRFLTIYRRCVYPTSRTSAVRVTESCSTSRMTSAPQVKVTGPRLDLSAHIRNPTRRFRICWTLVTIAHLRLRKVSSLSQAISPSALLMAIMTLSTSTIPATMVTLTPTPRSLKSARLLLCAAPSEYQPLCPARRSPTMDRLSRFQARSLTAPTALDHQSLAPVCQLSMQKSTSTTAKSRAAASSNFVSNPHHQSSTLLLFVHHIFSNQAKALFKHLVMVTKLCLMPAASEF